MRGILHAWCCLEWDFSVVMRRFWCCLGRSYGAVMRGVKGCDERATNSVMRGVGKRVVKIEKATEATMRGLLVQHMWATGAVMTRMIVLS